MKKIYNILVLLAAVFIITNCKTAGGIDDEIFTNATTGALAAWVTEPDADDLLLSAPGGTTAVEIEFLDETDGSSVEAFAMTVTDGTNSGTIISATSFSINSNGRAGFTTAFSLNDIAAALGVAVTTFSEEDEFDFTSTITRGGSVFPSGSVSTFAQAVQDFSIEIPVETVSVSAFETKNEFVNASQQKINLTFSNDFTDQLVTLPTVTRTTAQGATDDVLGTVSALQNEDGEDSVYQFTYTPGTLNDDTVSFTVVGASALTTAGFESAAKTYTAVFIVDNVLPTTIGNNSSVQTDVTGVRTGYRFNRLLSETIGKATLKANFTGKDDDEDGDIDEPGEGVVVPTDFLDNVYDYTFGWVEADGEVTLTLEIEDLAGNDLDVGTITVVLTP